MNWLHLPWLEASILISAAGAIFVGFLRDPDRASSWGLTFMGASFSCAFLAWLAYFQGVPSAALRPYSLQLSLLGDLHFYLDELSAPLVPTVALLHLLTALATPRTKRRRFSFAWSLISDALRLAMFSCKTEQVLVGLLSLAVIPPYVELLNRRKPTRVYVLHMLLFVGLLVSGWWLAEQARERGETSELASIALMAAVLVRCGVVPAHCWITDWFEHASFGNALLFVTPLAGVYAAIRLVLPIAPDWVLQSIGLVSLITAVYAAGMATVQLELRRLYAYLFISHGSLVLVGLELHTPLTLTASLCLWFSVILSLGGFGLTLRAIEARFGRLSLKEFHGLYDQSPMLAVCFMLTGLACVGFPGTLGFVSTDLLVDSAVSANMYVGFVVAFAAALNGIAVVRAYFLIFAGKQHHSSIELGTGPRERLAVLTLAALILGGGLYPQPGVDTRRLAAGAILKDRQERLHLPDPAAHAQGAPAHHRH